ncbi:MAG: hypothetical protein SFT81_06835 [Candidatus Caenarcaniphilales bacterium]|nr:hypothetical protein [Candidatus Caenarcaniphilales bacterium]
MVMSNSTPIPEKPSVATSGEQALKNTTLNQGILAQQISSGNFKPVANPDKDRLIRSDQLETADTLSHSASNSNPDQFVHGSSELKNLKQQDNTAQSKSKTPDSFQGEENQGSTDEPVTTFDSSKSPLSKAPSKTSSFEPVLSLSALKPFSSGINSSTSSSAKSSPPPLPQKPTAISIDTASLFTPTNSSKAA